MMTDISLKFCSAIPLPIPMTLRSRTELLCQSFAFKFLTTHIFQSIRLIWFIFGMMIDIGPRFNSAIPRHCQRPSINVLHLELLSLSFQQLIFFHLIDKVHIWYGDRYRFNVLFSDTLPFLPMTARSPCSRVRYDAKSFRYKTLDGDGQAPVHSSSADY